MKSIANNPDIKEGMSRAEIDAAIAKHADTETLYDQPYEDKHVVRVCGPFTVESLSPHRNLPAADETDAAAPPTPAPSPGDYVHAMIENLRKAGVQNTKKDERLTFDRLDPYAHEWLHAEGSYTEAGKTKTVAVCIGPEFGTVDSSVVQSAAVAATSGRPFNLLLVCGFAFDPHAAGQARLIDQDVVERKYGNLKTLLVRMNPDLSMGEALKKTPTANLFMVFGEPDVKLERLKSGQWTVEVRGVDVFDPTTGEIRSSDADDIACWFLDDAYDEKSFFVRHAYFLHGGKDTTEGPYDKLKKALKADIDEAAWQQLYRTKSVPFDQPSGGKIAVKVINHYGDEVLKVFDLRKEAARTDEPKRSPGLPGDAMPNDALPEPLCFLEPYRAFPDVAAALPELLAKTPGEMFRLDDDHRRWVAAGGMAAAQPYAADAAREAALVSSPQYQAMMKDARHAAAVAAWESARAEAQRIDRERGWDCGLPYECYPAEVRRRMDEAESAAKLAKARYECDIGELWRHYGVSDLPAARRDDELRPTPKQAREWVAWMLRAMACRLDALLVDCESPPSDIAAAAWHDRTLGGLFQDHIRILQGIGSLDFAPLYDARRERIQRMTRRGVREADVLATMLRNRWPEPIRRDGKGAAPTLEFMQELRATADALENESFGEPASAHGAAETSGTGPPASRLVVSADYGAATLDGKPIALANERTGRMMKALIDRPRETLSIPKAISAGLQLDATKPRHLQWPQECGTAFRAMDRAGYLFDPEHLPSPIEQART